MKLLGRLLVTDEYKGRIHYIEDQKHYEIGKTIVLFAISGSLFAAGMIATHTRLNLLTVVAILGCLPACKSLVNVIMFLRFKSFPTEEAKALCEMAPDVLCLVDNVFTAYDATYQIDHLALRDHTIIGYTRNASMDETKATNHLLDKLAAGSHKGYTVKIFKDKAKYEERLLQIAKLEDCNREGNLNAVNTLKAISL